MAKDFALQDLSGRTVRLSDFRGKVVLLDFWATYCEPCQESIPAFERLYRAHQAEPFMVVGVSEDAVDDAVPPFVRDHGMTYTVLRDDEQKTGDLYGLRGLPEAFLIDRKGRIAERWFGYDGQVDASIKEGVDRLLKGS